MTMKLLRIVGTLALGLTAVPAMSACSGTALNLSQLQAIFATDKLVCGRPGSAYPGGSNSPDRWQEKHVLAGGQLYEFGSSPADRANPIGTWRLSSTASRVQPATIVYLYSGGSGFTWAVYGPANNVPGSVYSFCTAGTAAAEHVRAYIVPVNDAVGCNNVFPP